MRVAYRYGQEERLLEPSERFMRKQAQTQRRIEEFLDDWDDRNDWREAGIVKCVCWRLLALAISPCRC